MKYCQSELHKKFGNGFLKTVTYIPQKFAKVGEVLKLQDENTKEWSDRWVVISCGPAIDEEFVPDYRQNIKAHRRATGDSLRRKENG